MKQIFIEELYYNKGRLMKFLAQDALRFMMIQDENGVFVIKHDCWRRLRTRIE